MGIPQAFSLLSGGGPLPAGITLAMKLPNTPPLPAVIGRSPRLLILAVVILALLVVFRLLSVQAAPGLVYKSF